MEIHFTISEFIVWTAGLLVALGVLWKGFEKLSNAYQWLKEIHRLLSPDDGESLADLLDRVDRNDTVLDRNLQKVYGVVLKFHNVDPQDAPLFETLETVESQRQRRKHATE